jgi:hypothetical protein
MIEIMTAGKEWNERGYYDSLDTVMTKYVNSGWHIIHIDLDRKLAVLEREVEDGTS